ncbi:MAG: DUF2127 domain-containing protein [Acidobacteriaceae bacterium]
MSSSALKKRERRHHDPGLLIIGVFKLLKGLLFVSLGFGIIHLVHQDVGDLLLRAALALRLDPESHFVNLALEKIQELSPHRIRLIGIGFFLYAVLDFIEGTGLVLEKTWAEYFTLILTASFLPLEVFEILHHFTWVKVAVTLINVLVLVYLIYIQRYRFPHKRRSA